MTHFYTSKPVRIEAAHVKEDNLDRVAEWCGGRVGWVDTILNEGVFVQTLNGETFAAIGHYVIKGPNDFYPCDPDTFDSRWERTDGKGRER